MKKETAVLIDLGFAIKKLQELLGRSPNATEIRSFALKCLAADEELFRIYCYHCAPFGRIVTHPLSLTAIDYSTTATFAHNTKLIADLKTTDNVAYRSGELSFQGWTLNKWSVKNIIKTGRAIVPADIMPDLKQKGVDMKIGLDVAWLASKRIVERIVLVTADSDFISPMKFARREGIQIILVTLGHTTVKKELKEHTDILQMWSFLSNTI